MKNKKHTNFEIEEHKSNPDWFLYFICGSIVGFGIGMLFVIM